ncbi:MAG: PKD domain-containing protein [Deinococcales bacterium]
MKKYLASVLVLFVIVACTPRPAQNTTPVSSFVLPSNVKAGQAVLFSSSAADADGDVLTQTWSFGDGGRAGGSSVAHQFDQAGTYTVTLTVRDTKGASHSSSQSLQVAAGTPLGAPIAVEARVRDSTGIPLSGVEIRLRQTLLGITDTTGNATVSVPTAAALSLRLNKTGYAEGIIALEYPSGSNASNAYFESTMLPRATAQVLDAGIGGSLVGADGVTLQLPANALERPDGTPVNGMVNVSMTPLDVTQSAGLRTFPGAFAGLEPNGNRTGIVSLGTTEFALEQNGQRLNLRPGSSAVVRLPMYANSDLGGMVYTPGSSVPLWSLDERTGIWVQEGTGTVVSTPTGLALEAQVGHFSWWNADLRFVPSRPKPKCVNDTPGQYDAIFAQAAFCKFLAEIDRGTSAQNTAPRLPAYAVSSDLPIGGNVALDVPAGVNIRYTGCIAGGQFCGTVVRNFSANSSESFEVRLKRRDTEAIELPFDAVRTINARKRFEFAGLGAQNAVKITLERVAGSAFVGAAVLLNAAGDNLVSGNLGSTVLVLEKRLFSTEKHILELVPTTNGAVRVRLERINLADTGAWQTIGELPSNFSFETRPQLAVHPEGHAATIWSGKQNVSPSLHSVLVSTFEASTNTWGAVALLEQVQFSSPEPVIALAMNRDTLALWSQLTAQGARLLRWARKPAAGVWSSPATLETASAGKHIVARQVYVLPNGDAVISIFEDGNGSGNQIRLGFYSASSNTWTLGAALPTNGSANLPILQLEPDGTPILLYTDFAPTLGVFARRYSSGAWQAATTVFSPAAQPDIESLRFVVVGGRGLAALSQNGTLRLRALEGATWKPEQSFAGVNSRIAVDGAGNATLLYREFANPAALLVRTYAFALDTWSAPQTLTDNSMGGVITTEFHLVVNSNGDAAAVVAKDRQSLFVSRVGGLWSAPAADAQAKDSLLGIDSAGRVLRLRFTFDTTAQKYVVQARRDALHQ